jgi:hypothetical protein
VGISSLNSSGQMQEDGVENSDDTATIDRRRREANDRVGIAS